MRILHVIPSHAASNSGPERATVEMYPELMRRREHAHSYTSNMDGNGGLDVPVETRAVVNMTSPIAQ